MPMCEKCGAHIEADMKYCDKCGSEIALQESPDESVAVNEEIINEDPIMSEEIHTGQSNGLLGQLEDLVFSLPAPLSKIGDRTSLLIGLGSFAVLAIVYIICFFSFMAEICMPVSMGVISEYMGSLGNIVDGASPLWIIVYAVFNLFPVFFAIYAFLNKKFRLYTIFASAFILLLTIFSFISWCICEPNAFIESLGIYNSAGSVAWYVLLDSLSEVWYLKLLLSLGAIFGFGVDYIINKGN